MDLCVLLFSVSLCDQFNVKIADMNAPSFTPGSVDRYSIFM